MCDLYDFGSDLFCDVDRMYVIVVVRDRICEIVYGVVVMMDIMFVMF